MAHPGAQEDKNVAFEETGRIPSRETTASKTPWSRRVQDAAKSLYQRTVVDMVLRRGQVGQSGEGRHIPLAIEHEKPLVDVRRGTSYVSNDIRTSRYTVWDFIPKQLFFQFSRVGNFYFLCVGIPQTIPGLSTTGSYTTILPLAFFVLLTIVKEGYDDYRRHRLDVVENANFATVLGRKDNYSGRADSNPWYKKYNPFIPTITAKPWPVPDEEFDGVRWVPTRWRNIKVGDVIRLVRDEPIPADIVLLDSDGENGLAYIETMALDGETNLKSRQISHALKGCDTIEGISRCRADFAIEDPNPDLFSFDGRLTVGEKTVPLTLNEVVYRGSVLRNTPRAIGIVVNTGQDCKIRMNSNKHPKAKKPALEKVVNWIVIVLAAYVIILSVGVSMGYLLWQDDYEDHAWYLTDAGVSFYQIIIAFIIMFNNVIPLSLYISLEIVKIGQLLMLNGDIEMYDEESDTPARCNTNTILENLGQVGYIFTDKTGTLTDNVMKFRKISVAGTVWLHEADMEPSDVGTTETETESTDESMFKPESVTIVTPKDQIRTRETPLSPSRPSFGRASSSHWRSTGRPDHVQPEVNTNDLIEYIRLRPNSPFARKAKDFILAVALCHTCLPENRDGKIDFQAASPDELALVRAAQDMGYLVVQRNSQSVTLEIAKADETTERQTFEILDVIEFSSARKRMSILVRYPDGRIAVICKGADSAILPRLKMASLAAQKATEVRMSAEVDREMYRRSEHYDIRNSLVGRSSLTIRRNPGLSRENSSNRLSFPAGSKSFEMKRLSRASDDRPRLSVQTRGLSFDRSRSHLSAQSVLPALPSKFEFLSDPDISNESETFTKCFRHLDDFATEGLRTLLFAQRFISNDEYVAWKARYDHATTSLVDRQNLIEQAGEMIEQSFDLVGASAIEDKLQKDVPETIDKLRRAHIKIWMLTGDKRETAINIAHSARICQPGSDLYILDSTKADLSSQLDDLCEDLVNGSIHSVCVIDGQTLAVIEHSQELSHRFYDLMTLVDSVICCRASPAQKALLVRTMRARIRKSKLKVRRGLTLAIGDGANDLAMISASHVGIGISGKEGLQAARVADYSIAQFRFLQRLLLVHGRWNYVRTAKFILCTFWKEMFFYLPQAQYQRFNGYTGTSLYESTSLTVYNTLFTSLCCICMGIWEQDLSAETLLAVPELYMYGQRNTGLNFMKFVRWMLLAAIEGVAAWYGCWAGYGWITPLVKDEGLYAFGQCVFTVGVLWINWKLFIFETHYKSQIVMISFFITTFGWFAWNGFLDAIYSASPSPYSIKGTFSEKWGADAVWWATVFLVLSFLGLFEFLGKAVKRNLLVWGLWKLPWGKRQTGDNMDEWDLQLWQEMEQDPEVRERLRSMLHGEPAGELLEDVDEEILVDVRSQ